MRGALLILAAVIACDAARISVSKGRNATKLDFLCARMHNNTALEGLDPVEMLKDTAYECQRRCVDMWPECSAVVYYYLHNETKHHYCYLFEKNSIHEKIALVEQKPEGKKDLVRMLELVADCHQFDAFPPLAEDGVASSTDKVDRKKRQNSDEQDVKTMGEWTDWSDCQTGSGHKVRSQACEYGRRIQRRGCPARQPPQRIDPRFQQPQFMQPPLQPVQPDPRQDPRYAQLEQQRQQQLLLQQQQQQEQQRQQQQQQQQQLAEHQRRQQELQQQAALQGPAGSSNAPKLVMLGNLGNTGLAGIAPPPVSPQASAPRLSNFADARASEAQQLYAQQYQQRVNVMRHPAQPNAAPCVGGVCVAPRAQPAPPAPPAPTHPPLVSQPTRYRPAPPPPPVCRGEGCVPRQQVFGAWHEWSEWSECSCTCGDGVKQRRRECNGNNCQGPEFEQSACNMGPCQTWSEWCEWSECKGSCGRGERTRTRFCFLGTKRCEGSDFEVDVCNAGPCPEWSEWEDWSQCSVSCGRGVVNRQRTCLGGVNGDHLCPGSRTEERPCDLGPCSQWAPWEEWSQCSASCGDGMKRRVRVCQFGTDCPGPAEESLFCYGPPCSAWTEWCEWSACSARCGPGQRSRTRACLTATGQESTDCAGPSHETTLCNEGECCNWSDWCPWSQCDRDCGTGQAFRTRVCQRNGVNDNTCECMGPDRETRECNTHACQPQCAWTEWCAWSDCSTTSACDIGVQQRSRQCVGEPGCHCMGLAEESQQCRGHIPCSPKPPC